jgi:hypothetical protein
MALDPIDLNALRRERKARQAAAGLEPYRFVYGPKPTAEGDPPNVFTIPSEADWPDTVGEPFEEGDLPKAFRILLGEAQWQDLHRHDPCPEIGDWIDLEAWLSAQQGIKSQGEGQAPPASSNGTAPSSKQTSSDTTGSTSPRRSPRGPKDS